MGHLLAIVTAVIMSLVPLLAQNSDKEQEVRRFLEEYDKAMLTRDIAFLERAIAGDYVYTGISGRMSTRAQMLQFLRRQRDDPTYKVHFITHENVNVRVVGNVAIVTNDYASQTAPVDAPDADPRPNSGRHTGVFEKRDGRWMAIAQQDTEQPNDDTWMREQVLKAGREYNELMKRLKSGRTYAELTKAGDIAALQRVLNDEYTYTSRDGQIFGKAEELEAYRTNRITLESAEFIDQQVRVIDNNTAVETGKIRYIGTNAGTPFDLTKRYTTTWVLRGRWQIVADHTSLVKQD